MRLTQFTTPREWLTPRRAERVVATLELFEHHFGKTSQSGLPPVAYTLSRPQN